MNSFRGKIHFYLLSLFSILTIQSIGTEGTFYSDVCQPSDSHCFFDRYSSLKLARKDPVKVGHVQDVELGPGKNYKIKTLAMRPPIFEIPDFLSGPECDHIIALAEKKGLEQSSTVRESVKDDEINLGGGTEAEFAYWDTDNSSFIDINEMLKALEQNLDFTTDKNTVMEMYSQTKLDKDGDGLVSVQEFKDRNATLMAVFIREVKILKPQTKGRHSSQAWLENEGTRDKIMEAIQRRVQKLTQLPMELIEASEYLQVVNYGPSGHYNCHLDSDFPRRELDCCHIVGVDTSRCRICRYLTVLYFLNDVEEGGETAFPVADNATFNEQVWMQDEDSLCNLAKSCHKANVVAKPKKGKAIMWYNHVVDSRTHWMGTLDHLSFHGGCDVIRGRKWIANNWISVGNDRKRDIWNWIELAPDGQDIKEGTESNSTPKQEL